MERLSGGRGVHTPIFDEEGRVIFRLIDDDQDFYVEFQASQTAGDNIRLYWPGFLPTEMGTITVGADGTLDFRTPNTYIADLDEVLVIPDLPTAQGEIETTNIAVNRILSALAEAGILRKTVVTVTVDAITAATSADTGNLTPEPASASADTLTEFDNSIRVESRMIAVDPTVSVS